MSSHLWSWPKTRRPTVLHGPSTQPCIPLESLNRVPASAGLKTGMKLNLHEAETITRCSFREESSLEHPSSGFRSRVLDSARNEMQKWLVWHKVICNGNYNQWAVTPDRRRCYASLTLARNTWAVTAIGMWGYPPVRITGGTCLDIWMIGWCLPCNAYICISLVYGVT